MQLKKRRRLCYYLFENYYLKKIFEKLLEKYYFKKVRRLFVIICYYEKISMLCHQMKLLRYKPDPYGGYRTLNDLVPITSNLMSYYNLHCSHIGPFAASQTSQVGSCLRTFALAIPPAWNALPQRFAWLTPSLPSVLCSHAPASVRLRLTSFLKNFNSPLDAHHQQLPITLTLCYFFPEYLSHSKMLSHLQLTLEQCQGQGH